MSLSRFATSTNFKIVVCVILLCGAVMYCRSRLQTGAYTVQQLIDAVEADDVKAAEDLHVMTCIECGTCSFSCPAYRPITQFCRRAKNSIRARISAEKAKAAAARK